MSTRSSVTSGHDPANILIVIALSVAAGLFLLLWVGGS
jgi:hypothetical protein